MSAKKTHGETYKNLTVEYTAWVHMLGRCYNINNTKFPIYGARGIKVCDRWLNSYENFLADMGRKPSPTHSLDRYPNNNGNYEPGNVRWATLKEQANNKSNIRMVTYNDKTLCIREWAKTLNVSYEMLLYRFNSGWSIQRALTVPSQRNKILTAIIFLFCIFSLKGQTSTTGFSPLNLIGAECGASSQPRCGVFYAMAIPFSTTSDTFSFTKIFQGSFVNGKLPASESVTGLAKRQYSLTIPNSKIELDLYLIGALGAATSTSSTNVAFNEGVGILVSNLISKWDWFKVYVGALQNDVVSTSNKVNVMISVGGRW